MTQTIESERWPRLLVLLFATIWLALAAMPAALAQDEGEPAAVMCDAEAFELDEEEEFFVFYVVEPGQEVACEASGLVPDEEAEWEVAFFDITEETDDPVEVVGELEEATEEGTLAFEFVVPDGIRFGVFEGFVAQGEEGAEDEYFEEFLGFIFALGPIECAPDPVTQGENVECVAEEMTEGEFEWAATFLTADEFLGILDAEDEDEIFEAMLAPVVEGTGSADADGIGGFDFDVPLEGEFEVYLAMALQEDTAYFAFYVGDVLPAEVDEEEVDEEEDAGEQDAPVVVERPARVETGGGGTADERPLAGLLLAGLMLAGVAALGLRRHATRAR